MREKHLFEDYQAADGTKAPGWMGITSLIWGVVAFLFVMGVGDIPAIFFLIPLAVSLAMGIMGLQPKRRYRKVAFAGLIVDAVSVMFFVIGLLLMLGYGAY